MTSNSNRHKRSVWRVAFVGAAVLVLLLVGWAVERSLAHRLADRFRADLSQGDRRVRFDRVSVCLPCLSYTLHGVELGHAQSEGPPILSAGAMDVGIAIGDLLRGDLQGVVALHDATLRLEIDEAGGRATAFSISWEHLGRGLLPVPIGRIETHTAEARVRYDHTSEPVEWRFAIDEGFANRLGRADARPRVFLKGTTPGEGAFLFDLRVGEPDPERASFQGTLRDVPLAALGGYVRERFGFEVEEGSMSAAIELAGTKDEWSGDVYLELVDFDVFDFADIVEEGPVQAATDGVAGIVASTRRASDGVLRMHLEVHEQVDEDVIDASWPWRIAGDILQWMLSAPFDAPFRLIESADTP